MTRKQDYIGICNERQHPLQDFAANVCIRCANLECHRSLASRASKFEDRVQNWHERLFEAPPRMTEQDPRFAQISAQRFISIPVGRVPEVGAAPTGDWIDPNAPEPRVIVPTTKVESRGTGVFSEGLPAAIEKPSVPAAPFVQQPVNTPLKVSVMLDGAGSSTRTQSDPWATPPKPDHVPAPDTGGIRKVTPGTKIRLGGDGNGEGSGV